jgi:hypothetical protein
MVELSKISKLPADYPLRRHEASGQWYKTISQKAVYFGVLSDPDSARERYDNYLAGLGKLTNAEVDANKVPGSITIEDGVNAFLTDKTRRVENSELSTRSLNDYKLTCERIIRVIGHETDAEKIEVSQLTKLREDIAKTRGFVAMATELQRCRGGAKGTGPLTWVKLNGPVPFVLSHLGRPKGLNEHHQ